ncbi:transposase [Streptomyces sp. NBC_00203]|uniref:transposase n=1 Tax=Streptomyces sp. NBC_00203 TaxID=2975680 RepID=UPI003244B133
MGTYKYSAEFRADAVALYRASPGRPVAAVARDLGVNHETLRLWIKAVEDSETPSVRAEADKEPRSQPCAGRCASWNWSARSCAGRRSISPGDALVRSRQLTTA